MDNKVSVIIPTYKRGLEYLSRAITSVIDQTYKNIEIIVVDDSPDCYAGRKAIANYMATMTNIHENILYLQNKTNLGGALARNRGINAARGEYISFLDDDDKYKPQKIEKQINYMKTHDCDMSFSNMIMYNSSGAVVDMRDYHDIPSFDNAALLRYHLMRHMTGTPTFMYKAEKLKEIGGFEDAKMGQEFFLMLKSIEMGLKIAYIDDCDVIVYKHEGEAISKGQNKINGEQALYEFKKKYFHILSKKEIRFIRFRHHAVMVVAYIRNSMYARAVASAVEAFLASPWDFVAQVSGFICKIAISRK